MQKELIYDQMTRSEKEVANFLKDLSILWLYKQPVFVWDENKRPRVWAPDFYLITFGIYIEVCGSENFDYEYRKNVYDNNGHRVIFLHLYKDTNRWMEHFMNYLERITNYRNQKLNEALKKEDWII